MKKLAFAVASVAILLFAFSAAADRQLFTKKGNLNIVFAPDGGGRLTVDAPTVTGTVSGATLVHSGVPGRTLVKVTVPYTVFTANATTQDSTIFTLPAKYRLTSIVSDTTTAFSGGGLASATLKVGKSAGGAEYVAVHDVMSSAVTKGLADADLGTSMTRAAAIQGGDLPSWTATTDVKIRMTTNAAMGNGTATNFTQGSVTFYAVIERLD